MKTLIALLFISALTLGGASASGQGNPTPVIQCAPYAQVKEAMQKVGARMIFSGVNAGGRLIMVFRNVDGWSMFYRSPGTGTPLCLLMFGTEPVEYLGELAI